MRINEFGIVSAMESMPVGVAAAAPAVPTDALTVWRDHVQVQAAQAAVLRVLDVRVAVPEDDAQHARLADLIAEAKRALKEVEDARKRVTEPLQKAKAAVDAEARIWREPVEAWVRQAEGAFTAYLRALDERRRRLQAEADARLLEAATAQQQAAEAGDQQEVERLALAVSRAEFDGQQAAQQTRGVKTATATVATTQRWTFEVVDAAQVPRRFLAVDEAAIRRAVAAGEREIPGVNVFQAAVVAVRSR